MGNTNKLSIAHIINPVVVLSNSDLFIAQPITFESMRIAGNYAKNKIDIEFYSAQYQEDRPVVPGFITKTVDLNRSILDITPTICKRKLPFIKDILDRLYDSSKADYFIYTNVDIALAKDFYICVSKIINSGYDAFTITRRTVSRDIKTIEDIPRMYMEKGTPHPGWDCFVFSRNLYTQFRLDDIIIGYPGIGRVLLANCFRYADRFGIFREEYLTFHIGTDSYWKDHKRKSNRAMHFNLKSAYKIVEYLYKHAPDNKAKDLEHHYLALLNETSPWRKWNKRIINWTKWLLSV